MRRVIRLVKRLFLVSGLIALAVVLFPGHTQPLWEWGQSVANAFGQDALPSFSAVQSYASLALLTLVVGGMAYSSWRDRCHEILQAEYAHQTGAKNLKQKVRELESELETVKAERERMRRDHAALSKEHTAALVAAKEHEIRSEYGREDREELRALRRQFEELVQAKGHTEGFRQAMHYVMADLSQQSEPSTVDAEATFSLAEAEQSNGAKKRTALPYGR